MPPRKPLKLVQSHLTKAEREVREQCEIAYEKPEKRPRWPVFLPKELRAAFNELADLLIERELLEALDRDALARYLIARASWLDSQQSAHAAIRAQDLEAAGDWTRIANTYFNQCRAAANDLGLTISSRCKLVLPAPKDEPENDPMAALLAGCPRSAEGGRRL